MAVFFQPGEATISTKFSVSCVSEDVRLVTSAEFARRTLKHFSASRFLAIAVDLYSFSEVLTIRPGVVHSIVCVTCVSNRVIARKLERKQKTKQNKTKQNKTEQNKTKNSFLFTTLANFLDELALKRLPCYISKVKSPSESYHTLLPGTDYMRASFNIQSDHPQLSPLLF